MSEFERPTYTKEQIVKAIETVLKYIEGAGSQDGFFPSDVAEALIMDFWLVQDVFTALVEQGVFEKPVFEKGFCPHPSFAIVTHPVGDRLYSLRCYECREDLPFNFYTEQEWAEILVLQKASSTRTEIG